MLDEKYFMIPEDYLFGSFVPFWKDFKFRAKLVYRKNRTDCDDFAAIFKAEIAKAALSLDTDAAPAVGIATVYNTSISLGISTGKHALNFIGTPGNWIFFEPITDQHAKLENYHSRIISLSI